MPLRKIAQLAGNSWRAEQSVFRRNIEGIVDDFDRIEIVIALKPKVDWWVKYGQVPSYSQ